VAHAGRLPAQILLTCAAVAKLRRVIDYEKLGVFYLGQTFDPAQPQLGAPVLLESQRLTTHAVCMGMTGSGKTGLCIGLLEEAAIDGIPVLAIDPKGDLGNLLLSFPGLAAADLAPWVDPAEAERRGVTREALAEDAAQKMRAGLEASLQDVARIERLRAAADFAIYTPGSNAGLSLSIVRSLEAPSAALREDEELFRERVSATVSGLLGLLDIEADPLQSREHILLARILGDAFQKGESLTLANLLARVKTPPFAEVGVLDLESFYPEKERMKLVLGLNNLLASPAFASWLTGEPLDIQALLYTPQGKPRVSILSIAHLDDKQRMFFVTLLLNEVLAWTRAQSGTSSLRAILYMDEVFGYFPPVAEPPSKRPMLTLLKQARAFGVGMVLATQNPVDLDYKGLSNIGTWLLGRLQTERDRARVLDGMEGAATTSGASFERGTLDAQLAALAPRTFVMHSARGGAPRRFGTRQTLSFLRGPLTRQEIKALMDPRKEKAAPPPAVPASPPPTSAAHAIPEGIEVGYLPSNGEATRYEPALLAVIRIGAVGGTAPRTLSLLTPFEEGAIPIHFENAQELTLPLDRLAKAPDGTLAFAPVPAAALEKKRYTAWGKEALASAIERCSAIVWKGAKLSSEPGESERDFRARVALALREARDAKVASLQAKYDSKLRTAREKEQKLASQLQREHQQANAAKVTSAFDLGGAILGAFFGNSGVSKADVQRASKVARSASKVSKEGADVERLQRELATAADARAKLEADLLAAIDALPAPADEPITAKTLKPKKSELQLAFIGLAFVPR
jgi:hypothetical protein